MVITNVNQVVYQGDGVTTAFPFTFTITGPSEVYLQLVHEDDTVTTITQDFYVDVTNNTVHYPGYAPGSEPPEANRPPKVQTGEKLVIYRDVPMTQEINLGDKWPFAQIEFGLDKLTMICQQIYSYTNRKLDAALASMFQLAGIVTDSDKLQHITDQYNAIDENAAAAAESADAADASALLSKKWANYTGGVVADGEYSAKKYATDSAISATNASNSAFSASTTATQLMAYLEDKETLTAPAVDPTLTISGAAADAKTTGDAIKSTKAEMSLFGVDDLLWDNTNPSNNTQNKVTWTVDKVNKTVTVTTDGTATGASVINFYAMTSPFPSWLEKGKKYRVHYNDNGSGIMFRIQYNTSSSTEIILLTTYSDADFVIPAEVTAIRIRLSTPASASGHTYNTVLKPFISEAKTLYQLEDADNAILDKINNGIGTVLPTWESGGISTTTGLDYTDNTKVRTNFIAVDNGDKYAVSNPGAVVTPILYYDSNKNFVSFESVINSTRYISIPSGVEYIRLQASDTEYPSAPITADFGRKVKVYRLDGALYNALQYMGIRWYSLRASIYTTIADLPTNTFARVPRDYLDKDVETLPYYNEIEYYVMTIGTPYYRSKMQIAIDPKWSVMYMRRYITGTSSYEDWTLIGKEIAREYRASDLNDGQYINLDVNHLSNLHYSYNSAQRVTSNANYKSLLIPVKKGSTVFLNTTAASSYALPYAKITYNYNIDYVYTDGIYFGGFITFDYDGFLAVNVYKTNYDKFSCKVFIDNAKAVDKAQFVNALDVSNNMIPQYDTENLCRVLKTGPSMMGAIHSWGIIGASWDCGEMNHTVPGFGQKEIEWEEYSCWTILKKLNGIPDMYIYADGGQNAKEWISLGANTVRGYAYDSDTEVVNPYWRGRSGIGHFGGCWWKMLDDYNHGIVKQAFYVGLGGNDINNNYPHNEDWTGTLEDYDETRYYECGTVDDIGTYDLATDTDTVPAGKTEGVVSGVVNSYCAYIGAILNRLLAIQPNCIIFLATPRNAFGENQFRYELWQQYCNAIRQIAQLPQFANNVYVLDMGAFGINNDTTEWKRFVLGSHPDAMGYHYLAFYLNTFIDYIIMNNYRKMKQSMYIGTDKHWDESEL